MLTVYQLTDNDDKSCERSENASPRHDKDTAAFCAALADTWERQWEQTDPTAERLDQIS